MAASQIFLSTPSEGLNLHHLDPCKVALRVDAENAFNRALHAAFLCLVCSHASASAQLTHALYGTQPYLVVGGTLLRSKEGAQQGYSLGRLLFALLIQPLIDHINEKCKLDYNVWCADDGIIFGYIDQVSEAYEILVREGPKYNFKLVKHKTKLWLPTMDCNALRSKSDCELYVDDNDEPLDGIVLV